MAIRVLVVGARGIPDVEGGAEKAAERTFPLVLRYGFDISLLGLRRFVNNSNFEGVKLVAAPELRLLRTDKIAYYIWAFFYALRHRPQIVHFQGLGSALFLVFYKLFGFRAVVRYGSADYILPKWGRIGRAGFLASEYQLRFADAVIAVTPALRARLLQRVPTAKVHVVPNAVDIEAAETASFAGYSPPEEVYGMPYVLAVGRVTFQKNLLALVEGFKRYRSRTDATTRLLLVGGLDDLAYVNELRRELDDSIILTGFRPRSALPSYFKHAALFVNASIHEGRSNAVLEAISWGTPVLISDITENRDLPLSEKHFFDPHSPSAISDAIETAMREREHLVIDPGQFGTWTEVACRTAAIYRGIV